MLFLTFSYGFFIRSGAGLQLSPHQRVDRSRNCVTSEYSTRHMKEIIPEDYLHYSCELPGPEYTILNNIKQPNCARTQAFASF